MDPLVIPIVALLIPIIIVPTAMGIKHARFLREVEHAERMRAMELGRTLAGDESWTPAGLAATIGAGVPIVALALAVFAGRMIPDPLVLAAAWKAAGMVGLGGVVCGTALAFLHFSNRAAAMALPVDKKPAYDPDEFDVVGRRG